MKLSLNWLNDFIDLSDVPVEDIVRELTLRTCEVEEHFSVFDHLDQVVLARVLTKDRHPDADRLSLCQVDAGPEKLPIVCGAPNVARDMLVPLAKIGAKLPMGEDILEIKLGKIRGEASHGMLCSPRELGLVDLVGDVDGLLDLGPFAAGALSVPPWLASGSKKNPAQKGAAKSSKKTGAKKAAKSAGVNPNKAAAAPKIGTPLSAIFPLKDVIIDIDNKSITHRPDLWSHYGFARELAVIFDRKLKFHPLDAKARAPGKGLAAKKIVIAKDAGHAYHGQHVGGVKIAPSPAWMQARLFNVGQRPLNNVVDATNYLMFEVGQPNHAFDARQLKTDTIQVATNDATGTKQFTTLDEEKRELPAGTILILDGKDKNATPVALGGIMGGLASGVADDTTDLFLESATFPRERIRRSLSSLQLRTESAIRFEKGQDPAQAKVALHRLVELLALSNPGLSTGKLTSSEPTKPRRNVIKIKAGFLQKRIGLDIPDRDIKKILERLGCDAALDKKGDWKITAPTYRSQYDLTIPEDIVEEVGRIHGLDRITEKAPLIACAPPPVNRARLFERRLKNHLARAGHFYETYNYSFDSREHNEMFGDAGLPLANSIAPDRDRMRVSLIPGMLAQAAGNQDRFDQVRLFEFGRIYLPTKKGELPREENRLVIAAMPDKTALKEQDGLFQAFLEFRAFLEETLAVFIHEQPDIRAIENPSTIWHPNCAVEIATADGKALAHTGVLSPVQEKQFGIKRPTLLAEIFFDVLFAAGDSTPRDYSPPSVYPDSEFEVSIVMPATDSTKKPVDLIRGLRIPEARQIKFIGNFQDDKLKEAGKMSASFAVRCGQHEGTLSGERLQEILDAVIKELGKAGYPLR